MEILIGFIIAIVVLVFVHELGHFVFAKWTGCRVDEFAVGFPPALFAKQYGETKYILGSIPIGGYVKIWGENGSDEASEDPSNPRAFYNRPRWAQAVVLLGGIIFNIILTWLLFAALFIAGIETNVDRFPNQTFTNPQVQITGVLDGYPAASSSLAVASTIQSITTADGETLDTISTHEQVQEFVSSHQDTALLVTTTNQAGEEFASTITPRVEDNRALLGLELVTVGTVTFTWHQALLAGGQLTWELTGAIFGFLGEFLGGVFTGASDTSEVAGPVGIANFAGDSLQAGVGEFVWFLAILSLNLAIFNLLPIPALDGGRLVLVAIESVICRPLDPRWMLYLNSAGFIFLIGLMLLVTISDVSKLL
jgi:regulator of sigma E protease